MNVTINHTVCVVTSEADILRLMPSVRVLSALQLAS